ncbi:hypothetical protein HI792_06405 [Ralstonia solanacearum]|nr:hypothetical protein HI792_06405 [Ralstonia solanacearum]
MEFAFKYSSPKSHHTQRFKPKPYDYPPPATRHPPPATRHPAPGTRHPAPGTTLKSLKINKTINSESGISTTSFNSGDGFILDKECFRKSAQKCA